VPTVTGAKPSGAYLPFIEARVFRAKKAKAMTAKFACLVVAALMFAPVAYATLNQAAQIYA
jgi:hypothetical protein